MWISIGIVIALVVVTAGFFYFRSIPRMQHYMFAHDIAPRAILSDPVAFLPQLLSDGRSVASKNKLLAAWWAEAKQSAPIGRDIPIEQMQYWTEVLGHPNTTAFIIEMPKIEKPAEAIAVLAVGDGPGIARGKSRLTRYFTLEARKNGNASISEWVYNGTDKLEYREHVKLCSRDVSGFIKAVQEILHLDGSMPGANSTT